MSTVVFGFESNDYRPERYASPEVIIPYDFFAHLEEVIYRSLPGRLNNLDAHYIDEGEKRDIVRTSLMSVFLRDILDVGPGHLQVTLWSLFTNLGSINEVLLRCEHDLAFSRDLLLSNFAPALIKALFRRIHPEKKAMRAYFDENFDVSWYSGHVMHNLLLGVVFDPIPYRLLYMKGLGYVTGDKITPHTEKAFYLSVNRVDEKIDKRRVIMMREIIFPTLYLPVVGSSVRLPAVVRDGRFEFRNVVSCVVSYGYYVVASGQNRSRFTALLFNVSKVEYRPLTQVRGAGLTIADGEWKFQPSRFSPIEEKVIDRDINSDELRDLLLT